MDTNHLLEAINRTESTKEERLAALAELKKQIDNGTIVPDACGVWVNNHIHTSYSFSPYTPAAAVFYAWKAGLRTAGIMDHDSVGGAEEFLNAGQIMNMPVTVGFECRVSVAGTPMEGRHLNNPDQVSCAYVAMHGIPAASLPEAEKVLSRVRELRNDRNREMCRRITTLLNEYGIQLDFERDVLPLSMYHEGGSVTERHISYALVQQINKVYPDRNDAIAFIERLTGAPLADATKAKILTAPANFYDYDMLGIIKSSVISQFYVPATAECMHITEFIGLANRLGAIPAYAYLGDVGVSVTGDKAAHQYEDSYLDELFDTLSALKFNAVTYMPSRNTMEQLNRVMNLCERYGMFQISGEDINSPRQSFICPALSQECFAHLRVAAYALIGHEKAAADGLDKAMFAPAMIASVPSLDKRVHDYAVLAGYQF